MCDNCVTKISFHSVFNLENDLLSKIISFEKVLVFFPGLNYPFADIKVLIRFQDVFFYRYLSFVGHLPFYNK
jgi:hypothetical protein